MLVNHSPVWQHSSFNTQRGISIVELLVGLTVGLIVMSGVISLFVNNLGETKRLRSEAQLNQELRTAADLIARDLRRAGYWTNSIKGTIATGSTSVTASNPYVPVSASGSASECPNPNSKNQITYNFARDANDTLDTTEQFGFKLENNIIKMKTDTTTWQDITNSNVIRVKTFCIEPSETVLPIGDICQNPCVAGSSECPTLTIREYRLTLGASPAGNTSITRELRMNVRVRNDQFAGICPLS